MSKARWMLGLAVTAAGFALGMCGKNNQPVATMTRPAGIIVPGATEPSDTEDATRLAEMVPISPPLLGKAEKLADGQVWDVFPNGIGIQVLKPGTGTMAKPGMRATIVYTEKLAGTGEVLKKFTKADPYEFILCSKHEIKGLSFALLRGQMGLHERVWLPANWAYGAEGLPPKVGPNQDLILDVELVTVAGTAVDFPDSAFTDKPGAETQGLDLKFLDVEQGPTTGKAGEKN